MKTIFQILVIILAGLFLSCQKENKECYCETENPEARLPWLKYILERRFCTLVYDFKYEDVEYVAVSDCEPPDLMVVFYTCDGDKLCELGGIFNLRTCTDEFIQAYAQTKELIYSKEN